MKGSKYMDLITAKKIKKEYTYWKWQINANETFTEEMTIFTLTGKNVTYALAALESGHLAHIYYGKRADDEDLSYLMRLNENPFVPKVNERDMGTFMDTTPFEYPCHGIGDYREPAVSIMDEKGMTALDLRFKNCHNVFPFRCCVFYMYPPAIFRGCCRDILARSFR